MPLAIRSLYYVGQLDPFKETGNSMPILQRLFSRPRLLQREKLEPLFVVLSEIANAHEKTMAQVALNWLLTRDTRVIPIPGAKNARQASENARALSWRLTDEEHARISQAEMASR
jgi:aryl-alcohol dehydrogenase-like predicted oxidoreductase